MPWSQIMWNLRGQNECGLYLEGNGVPLKDFKKENTTVTNVMLYVNYISVES